MMKNRYIAFIRGINVGGNRIIKNTDLKACFEKMGFSNVQVILQSGNVVFESFDIDESQLKTFIETDLEKQFHFPAKIILHTKNSLQQIVQRYPFDSSHSEEQHYVVFLSNDIQAELAKAANLDATIEQIATGNRVIYWKVKKGMTVTSTFGKILSKTQYKDLNTVRNINTLEKILQSHF